MFGTIRRHQSWLWAIIVVLMIISLLYWVDQRPNGGGSQMGEQATVLNGKTVTPTMLKEALREVDLLYFLNFRKWPEQDSERAQQMGFDKDNQAWLRLLRVAKAEEAGVRVSSDTVATLAKRLLGDFPLDKFEKEVLQPNGLSADDFERFVRHDAVIQQLSTVVGAAGRLITPAEAEALYRRDHQEVGGDIIFFNISNYLGKVAITNGALSNFFTLRQSTYRVPDRLRVSYVEFPKTNFYAEADKQFATVTNLELQLREMYIKSGGTNAFKDTNGVPLSESAALAQIKDDQRERMALGFANKRANEFANKVYDEATKGNDPGRQILATLLDNVAAAEGLKTQITVPFDMEQGPTNLDVSPMFTRIAFSLNATNNPISFQPVPGQHAMYLIALKDMIPGRAQSFDEVKKQVEEDYRRMNAFSLTRTDATNFVARATNDLAKGKSFAELAQQANLKAEALPPISRATESITNLEERLDIRRLKGVALSLEPGKISDYIMNPPEGGYLLHVRAKIPFDEAKLRVELPKFTSQLRYQKQNELFDIWFNKQIEGAKLPLRQASPRRPGA